MDVKLIMWAHEFLQKGNGPALILHLKKSVILFSVIREWNFNKFHPSSLMVILWIFLLEKLEALDGFDILILVSQFCLHVFR